MSDKIRVAINGFGRIGRSAFKIALEHQDEIEVVAINDLGQADYAAYLLKYDTVYGTYDKVVKASKDHVEVDGKRYPMVSIPGVDKLPWKEYQVDVVLECTGAFTKAADVRKHITAGAKAAIISAPAKGDDPIGTYVIGANADQLDPTKENIFSNASCTTNCIAPVMALMHSHFTVLKSLMTTVHAYTATQALVDGGKAKDWRESRAAALNIIPTSTGAPKATALTIPDLKGKFDGISMRVPVAVGSISDITMLVGKKTSVEEINAMFTKAANENPMYKGVLAVTEEPLVSSDIVGSTYSAIVDLPLTRVIDGDLVKVVAWYDNEWGYSNRLVEQAINVGKRLSG